MKSLKQTIQESKLKISLQQYKTTVKKLVDAETFNDQLFYDEMIDSFTKGIAPHEFVKNMVRADD